MRTAFRWRGLFPIFLLLLASSVTGCATTWNYVQYTSYTGGDDLNGSKSLAIAYLTLNNGQTYACVLNEPSLNVPANITPPVPGLSGQQAGWFPNDSTNVSTCPLPGVSGYNMPGGNVRVALWQKNCDLYCDNWDLEGLSATVYSGNPAANPPVNPAPSSCILNAGYFGPGDHGEHPAIARLKGGNGGVNDTFSDYAPQTWTVPSSC